MKRIVTFLFLVLLGAGVMAQYDAFPLDFEAPEEDTAWTYFANGSGTAEDFMLDENPDKFDINQTDYCLKFIVAADASPWAGFWSDYYPTIDMSEDISTMYMLVFKDVITNSCIKLEQGTSPVEYEVKVPNTVTDVWEVLAFDMSAGIGNSYPRLTLFPDFPDTRTSGSTCYIDLVGFEDHSSPVKVEQVDGVVFSIFPNPASEMIQVQFRGMKTITISNITGQMVKHMVSGSNYIEKVDISDLKDGIYFLTLDTDRGAVSSKFIKK